MHSTRFPFFEDWQEESCWQRHAVGSELLESWMELNTGEGESFVQATGTGAKLAKKDPIQLRLYRNGIVMFDGPFRSYQEHSTQQCMQDLMDGYFPSELQQRFPDGIPFEVRLCSTFSVCKCAGVSQGIPRPDGPLPARGRTRPGWRSSVPDHSSAPAASDSARSAPGSGPTATETKSRT
uniref:UBX domain-containing protein 11 n=1 Tax=Poecilia reticulata TaxID=8081 RepID=A0A3P9NV46_POERE